MTDLIVVDLCKTSAYNSVWENCLDFINKECKTDKLYKNYCNLNPNDFISLPVAISNDEIIAFSGAEIKPNIWGPFISRISSKFWLHPKVRTQSLTKFNPTRNIWYNSKYLIPYQLAEIKRLEIPHIFISRQGKYQKSFQRYISLVNTNNNVNFEILKKQYNVCGPKVNTPECYQTIAIYSFETNLYEAVLAEETLLTL
jgi:hypothetical protein